MDLSSIELLSLYDARFTYFCKHSMNIYKIIIKIYDKNVKHFQTIYYHQQDFVTARGKGPFDGGGGVSKETQISTALELYEWDVQDECFPT